MQEMHLRLATCLGQLGALDPANANIEQPPPAQILLHANELLPLLLGHVLRVLRTTQHIAQVDLCMYALHKLLALQLPGAPLSCVDVRTLHVSE